MILQGEFCHNLLLYMDTSVTVIWFKNKIDYIFAVPLAISKSKTLSVGYDYALVTLRQLEVFAEVPRKAVQQPVRRSCCHYRSPPLAPRSRSGVSSAYSCLIGGETAGGRTNTGACYTRRALAALLEQAVVYQRYFVRITARYGFMPQHLHRQLHFTRHDAAIASIIRPYRWKSPARVVP